MTFVIVGLQECHDKNRKFLVQIIGNFTMTQPSIYDIYKLENFFIAAHNGKNWCFQWAWLLNCD